MGNEQGKEAPEKDGGRDIRDIQRMDSAVRGRIRGGVQYNMKIVIRGERGSGKTALWRRLQALSFDAEYVPTAEIQTSTINWGFKNMTDAVKVEVWDVVDTALTEERETAEESGDMDPDVPAGLIPTGTFRLGSNNIAALDASMVDVYKYAQAVLIMVNPFSPTAEQYVRVALEDVPLSVCVCVLINFRDCLETSYLQIPGAPQPRISKSQLDQLLLSFRKRRSATAASPQDVGDVHMFECSMQNCFGLRVLHSYLNVPFLKLKIHTLDRQIQQAYVDQEVASAELEAAIQSHDFPAFAEQLKRSGKAKSAGPIPPVVAPSGPDPVYVDTPPRAATNGGLKYAALDREYAEVKHDTELTSTSAIVKKKRKESKKSKKRKDIAAEPAKYESEGTLKPTRRAQEITDPGDFTPDAGEAVAQLETFLEEQDILAAEQQTSRGRSIPRLNECLKSDALALSASKSDDDDHAPVRFLLRVRSRHRKQASSSGTSSQEPIQTPAASALITAPVLSVSHTVQAVDTEKAHGMSQLQDDETQEAPTTMACGTPQENPINEPEVPNDATDALEARSAKVCEAVVQFPDDCAQTDALEPAEAVPVEAIEEVSARAEVEEAATEVPTEVVARAEVEEAAKEVPTEVAARAEAEEAAKEVPTEVSATDEPRAQPAQVDEPIENAVLVPAAQNVALDHGDRVPPARERNAVEISEEPEASQQPLTKRRARARPRQANVAHWQGDYILGGDDDLPAAALSPSAMTGLVLGDEESSQATVASSEACARTRLRRAKKTTVNTSRESADL